MEPLDVDRIADAHRRLCEILLRHWDPLGVSGIPEAADEYSNYVRQVYDVATRTRCVRAVAELLVAIEKGQMGLWGWRRWNARAEVAQRVLDLVASLPPIP